MKKITPQTKEELKKLIKKEMEDNGNACDLNHIDTSLVTDFSQLFIFSKFNGNISQWKTSQVTSMNRMFLNADFNGDISKWDVSSVTDMVSMFHGSAFNSDISQWNTSSLLNMKSMFASSPFNQDISQWNVEKVEIMACLFMFSQFNQDLTFWKPINIKNLRSAFSRCTTPHPYWYHDAIEAIPQLIHDYHERYNLQEHLHHHLNEKDIIHKRKI